MRNFFKKMYLLFLKIVCLKCYQTINTSAPITLGVYFYQKILRINGKAYWPVHYTSSINNYKNIKIGIGTAPGLSPGCYIQGNGKIFIGDYSTIAPNVGIISSNHDIYNYKKHTEGEIHIGKYCWIGMNSIILPNVKLGDHTIVGSGSVVTKSFEEGYCIIAGNPAKMIKKIDKDKCVSFKNEFEYFGYIKKEKFTSFREKKLNL